MSKGVMESQCTKCTNRHVCKYRDTYLRTVETIMGVKVDGVSLSELEFLNPIEVDCKYETNVMKQNIRSCST